MRRPTSQWGGGFWPRSGSGHPPLDGRGEWLTSRPPKTHKIAVCHVQNPETTRNQQSEKRKSLCDMYFEVSPQGTRSREGGTPGVQNDISGVVPMAPKHVPRDSSEDGWTCVSRHGHPTRIYNAKKVWHTGLCKLGGGGGYLGEKSPRLPPTPPPKAQPTHILSEVDSKSKLRISGKSVSFQLPPTPSIPPVGGGGGGIILQPATAKKFSGPDSGNAQKNTPKKFELPCHNSFGILSGKSRMPNVPVASSHPRFNLQKRGINLERFTGDCPHSQQTMQKNPHIMHALCSIGRGGSN